MRRGRRQRIWTLPGLLAASTLAGLASAMAGGAMWERGASWVLLTVPIATLAMKIRRD